MATDGPTPPPCSSKLMKKGVGILIGGTAGACAFEKLVKEVAANTGKSVDWHYVGGRAVIRCMPKDEAIVREEIEKTLRPKLDEMLRQSRLDLDAADTVCGIPALEE